MKLQLDPYLPRRCRTYQEIERAIWESVCASSIDSSNHEGFTSKVGIDATKPLGAEVAMFEKATV